MIYVCFGPIKRTIAVAFRKVRVGPHSITSRSIPRSSETFTEPLQPCSTSSLKPGGMHPRPRRRFTFHTKTAVWANLWHSPLEDFSLKGYFSFQLSSSQTSFILIRPIPAPDHGLGQIINTWRMNFSSVSISLLHFGSKYEIF